MKFSKLAWCSGVLFAAAICLAQTTTAPYTTKPLSYYTVGPSEFTLVGTLDDDVPGTPARPYLPNISHTLVTLQSGETFAFYPVIDCNGANPNPDVEIFCRVRLTTVEARAKRMVEQFLAHEKLSAPHEKLVFKYRLLRKTVGHQGIEIEGVGIGSYPVTN